jgi:hypothetical protein
MASIALRGIDSESTVVLYEPAGGRIVHVHHVVTVEGGAHPDETAIERAALGHLSPAPTRGNILPLHVPSEAFTAGRLFRVDPQKKALIELPIQPLHPEIR